MLDLFELRFGHRVSVGLFVAAVLGELFWSAAILTALGTTLSTLLGFDFTTSVLVSAAIAIGYTRMGGLRSVAKTDVFQLCVHPGWSVSGSSFPDGDRRGMETGSGRLSGRLW